MRYLLLICLLLISYYYLPPRFREKPRDEETHCEGYGGYEDVIVQCNFYREREVFAGFYEPCIELEEADKRTDNKP